MPKQSEALTEQGFQTETRLIGIGCLNFLVDIAVGFFTVWGLYWAASEFTESAVKPVLHLLPGRAEHPFQGGTITERYTLLRNAPFHIVGCKNVGVKGSLHYHPTVACGIYLENEKSRAGRYVRLVIRVHASPEPQSCEFAHADFAGDAKGTKILPGKRDPDTGHLKVSAQFAEELVVYQSPVDVGELSLCWPKGLTEEELPTSVILDYDAYALDGKPSHGKVELVVAEWR